MGQKSNVKAPSVREAVRKINGFKSLICAQEALSRGGDGGIVRIEAMAPVMDAIDRYVALFPEAEVER
jgi:hypothetical protein